MKKGERGEQVYLKRLSTAKVATDASPKSQVDEPQISYRISMTRVFTLMRACNAGAFPYPGKV
jgi:hypothetical protein